MFKFIELPKGNGQTVFIDIASPDLWFASFIFVNNTLRIKIESSSVHALLYQTYNDAFKLLEEQGYKIIIDSSEIDENTFFFTPCIENWQELDAQKYLREFEGRTLESISKSSIKKPNTFSLREFFAPDYNPKLPFVIKNENSHCGSEKILITTPKQLDILKEFFETNPISLFDAHYVVQEYIETPTEYNTSLRVLVSLSEEILCSTLKYAEPDKTKNGFRNGVLEAVFLDPYSPHFLDAKSIVSNTATGGNNILLGESNYSEKEQEILLAHAINPEDATVPESVRVACSELMKSCGKELGAICGIDFIYDNKTKTWKYLENHSYPMLHSYALKKQLSYTSTEFRSDRDKELDLIARMHSLSLSMKKKRNSIQQKTLIQAT